MNALADAAFLQSSPNQSYSSAAYTGSELNPMGAIAMTMNQSQTSGSSKLAQPSRSLIPPQQLPGPGRHLQILDHTVHRIDVHTKNNGEQEKEMVVSNLRHFTLKIGVLDPRCGVGLETELPLKAELLYENGQLVEQLATCEPLLVGKTEVVALQGSALFKLRITSLSSHRDKQRFRIRVSPTDTNLLLREPGLSVVTTPMKCVTKLSHRSSANGAKMENDEEEGEWENDANGQGIKRKRDEIEPLLEVQSQQLQLLQRTNSQILEQLQGLKQLLWQLPTLAPAS